MTASHVVVRAKSGEQRLAIAEVRSIAFEKRQATELMATPGQHVVVTEDGSRLAVADASIADGKLLVKSAALGPIATPLDVVVRLLRPRAHERPLDMERQRVASKIVPSGKDALLVSGGPGEWVVISGILNGMRDGKVSLTYEGADTALDAPTVGLIEMARPADRRAPPNPGGYLTCTDGSRLAFTAIEVRGNQLRLSGPSLPVVTVDAAMAAAIRFEGQNLSYLSDLKPAVVRETSFFDELFPHRIDKSVAGTPLRMGGRALEKGLGMHARCELSYELGGQYKLLVAQAGIDQSVSAGAGVLRILGDGKPLLEDLMLMAGEAPKPVRIELTGVKVLTLVADFAKGTFGAGARVNLGDPVLSK